MHSSPKCSKIPTVFFIFEFCNLEGSRIDLVVANFKFQMMSKYRPGTSKYPYQRQQMLSMLSKMRSNEDRQSDSEESEEESEDKTNSSVPPISSSANSLSGANKKALPLQIGNTVVAMRLQDTVISSRSIHILNQVPTYKGIKTRVPEYYVVDEKNGSEISLTSQLKAITLFIRSYMATQIRDENIKLKVCNIIFRQMF